MAYGLCDIPLCEEQAYMGWRPLTEQTGHKICESHFVRHKNKNDRFDLFDTFGFRKSPTLLKAKPETQSERCACGKEVQPGHKFCTACASERECQRKREYYHRSKEEKPPKVISLRCNDCGNEREPNHRYCRKCGQRRIQKSHRKRQQRYWKKHNV